MSILESAKQYIELGWHVHPVKRDKTPLLKGWPAKATTDESQVAAWWKGNGQLGIGIATGALSDLVVLDIDPRHDGDESLRELEQRFGTLPVTVTCKTGGGGRQFYFRYPQDVVIKNKIKVDGLEGVDVRGEGGYVVAPPSMHPSGGQYKWISETYELADLPSAWISLLQQQPMADTPTATPGGGGQLRQSTIKFIANGAAKGERNGRLFEAAVELAGAGFDRSVAEAMLTQGAARCVPPLDDMEASKTIKSAFSRPRTPFIEDEGELGWTPAGGAENNSVNSVTRFTGLEKQNSGVGTDIEWEPPIPLGRESLPVFPTPQELPELDGLFEYIEGVAESYQVPIDLPAMLVLTVAAAALSKKVIVHVRGDYIEPINVYSCTVLDPANRKTGVFKAVIKPLLKFEAAERERLAPAAEASKAELEILQASRKYEQNLAAKAKSETERHDATRRAKQYAEDIAAFELITVPTLLADDITPEALSRLLNENDGRLALMSPEGGVFQMMGGRYSSGLPPLDIYLKSHIGDCVKVHRIGRPDEYVQDPALTIGLTVQYDVLRSLSTEPSFRGRGLLGRFFYSLPASLIGRRKINPKPLNPFVATGYEVLIKEALGLERLKDGDRAAEPYVFTFCPSAQVVFDEFSEMIERELAAGGQFENLRDWAGKMVGAVARIAGILHGLQFARDMSHTGGEINKPTTKYSIAVGWYLARHALVAFQQMGPSASLAERILRHIVAKAVTDFTRRDVHRWVGSSLNSVLELEAPLELLESHWFIRQQPETKRVGAGQPASPRFFVNPLKRVTELTEFAPRSESETDGATA